MRWGLATVVTVGLAVGAAAGLTSPPRPVVAIQPLGAVDASLVEAVRVDVAAFFDAEGPKDSRLDAFRTPTRSS